MDYAPSMCTLWHGLTDVGDGRRSGYVMDPDDLTLCRSFQDRRIASRRRGRGADDNDDDAENGRDMLNLQAQQKYRPPNPIKQSRRLTRLQAVQQLFFAYINRTEAYDHVHRIALILFGDEVSTACAFTPLFGTFSNSVDRAKTGGDTRLFDAMARWVVVLNAYIK